MLSVNTAVSNFTGSVFPFFEAKNASGAGSVDGTEYTANVINNWMFGWSQYLLAQASMTPDGIIESGSASQIFKAMRNSYAGMPAGTIIQYPMNAAPTSLGHRCVLLAGQSVLVASYPDLVANTYVGDANNSAVHAGGGAFYKCDNPDGSSPNVGGAYLKLPDTRGLVPRGIDAGAIRDPDGASRYLGGLQQDAFQGHRFQIWTQNSGPGSFADVNIKSGTVDIAFNSLFKPIDLQTGDPATDGTNGTPRVSPETRMWNFATQFAITF